VRALVAGGAGFIGAHIARRLLEEGWEVVVADNLASGRRENVPAEAQFVWTDLTDESAVAGLPDVDVVFHLASHVGQQLSFERPVHDLKVNALSTAILLEWSRRRGVQQFLLASTVNVYGDPAELPVTEAMPLAPPSPYAIGKVASEQLCSVYHALGLPTSSLRLFNIYGPLQDMGNLKQGMLSIYMAYVARGEPVLVRGSTDRFRDFVWVEDAADSFLRCVDERAYGKIYNVATGRKTQVSELLKEIIRAFEHDPDTYPVTIADPTPGDQSGTYGDATRLREDVGWRPTVELEDGVGRMADWVRQTGAA
jgi:UDP-glucose 4-epimerase